jgi:hypothetical protein
LRSAFLLLLILATTVDGRTLAYVRLLTPLLLLLLLLPLLLLRPLLRLWWVQLPLLLLLLLLLRLLLLLLLLLRVCTGWGQPRPDGRLLAGLWAKVLLRSRVTRAVTRRNPFLVPLARAGVRIGRWGSR